jgi:hypothetical protein
MERLKYSDLLNRLEGFDPWLSSLGLTVRPNESVSPNPASFIDGAQDGAG